MTNTDSLMYEIETEDFYRDIQGDLTQCFDTSKYPENHPLFLGFHPKTQEKNRVAHLRDPFNENVPGMFKDKAGGKNITEFVGLRSKLYSHKIDDGVEPSEHKKCKRIFKKCCKKNIIFKD